jgi:hypothetical protein
MSRADPLDRLAAAAERIADALEYLARATVPAGPQPQLKIARSPTDTSPMEPVTLRPEEGLMMAIVQNVGDADTLLERPTARVGEVEIVGEMVDRDSRPQPSLTAPAAPGGPGVIVQFHFERQAQWFADLPLLLCLPHRPGRMPGTSILEVRMEPTGQVGGRYHWRVVSSQVVPQANATA